MENQLSVKDEIKELLETALGLYVEDIAQAIRLAERALFKSQKIKVKSEVHADGLNLLSILQRRNKEYGTAKSLAERAIKISVNIGYGKGAADAHLNIAKSLILQQKQSDAIPHLLDASVIYEELNDLAMQGKVLNSLGNIYEEFKNFKNALSCYEKALKISTNIGDASLEAESYLCLGNFYLKTERPSKASKYIAKSIHLKKEFKTKKGLAKAYFVYGKIRFKNKDLDNAENDFLKALELYIAEDDVKGIVESQEELGNIYLDKKENIKAIEILSDAVEKAKEHGFNQSVFHCNHLLYKVYKKSDSRKALVYLEKYVEQKNTYDQQYIQNLIGSHQVFSKIEDHEKDAEKEMEVASIIEKKNTEMDSFFYRVSHDLKGPIASLLGLSDLAKRDIKDDKALNYINMYENQIKRLNMIVMELINITELNYKEIKRTTINFYEIIDNCITAYTYLPNFDRITFKVEILSNLNFSSEWYIVNTILQNLIENSIKYFDRDKDHSHVHISVIPKRDNILIKVADNGQGIAKEHQVKIFDMFYRANNTAEGTGLGLFILKRAVERLKGEVSLVSEVGVGSTFTVTLPKNIQ